MVQLRTPSRGAPIMNRVEKGNAMVEEVLSFLTLVVTIITLSPQGLRPRPRRGTCRCVNGRSRLADTQRAARRAARFPFNRPPERCCRITLTTAPAKCGPEFGTASLLPSQDD